MSVPVQVFGRRQRRSNHAYWRPASEKRQGTKSRREVARGRRRGLWGFCRGLCRGCDAWRRQRLQSCHDGNIRIGVWSSSGHGLRCCGMFLNAHCAQYSRRYASGTAGGEPGATMSIVVGVGRRQRRSNPTLWRPASEKRQGTKSRREIGCGGAAGTMGILTRAQARM
jgi:hypothetical protein